MQGVVWSVELGCNSHIGFWSIMSSKEISARPFNLKYKQFMYKMNPSTNRGELGFAGEHVKPGTTHYWW